MKPLRNKTSLPTLPALAILAASFMLSGCGALAVGDAVSAVASDKTIGDHAVSFIAKKDCSTIRKELGLTYCKEDDPQRLPQPKMHCYRELGKVTCYQQADLYSVRKSVEDKKEPPKQWSK